jgi:hypothetical protein
MEAAREAADTGAIRFQVSGGLELEAVAKVVISSPLAVMDRAMALEIGEDMEPGDLGRSPAEVVSVIVEMAIDPDTPRQEARDYVEALRGLLTAGAIVIPSSDSPVPNGPESTVVTLPAAQVVYGFQGSPEGPFRRCAWVSDPEGQCQSAPKDRAGKRGPLPRYCDGHTKARKQWLRKHGKARDPYKPCCVNWQLDPDPSHTGRCPQCRTQARKTVSPVSRQEASEVAAEFGGRLWHVESASGMLSD